MESAINLDHIKELLYFYSISDRNSKSFLNKNLEKEKYVNTYLYILYIYIYIYY